MRLSKHISLIALLLIVFTSCNDAYKFKLTTTKKTVINQVRTATLTEVNNKPIDSIQFFVNGKRVASKGNSININTKELGVGKFTVTALAIYPEKTKKVNKIIRRINSYGLFIKK